MERKAEHDISRKLKVLNHATELGNISKTCRYFGICREAFYTWRRAYESGGNDALFNNEPCPENHKLRIPRLIEDKSVYLRSTYHCSQVGIIFDAGSNDLYDGFITHVLPRFC